MRLTRRAILTGLIVTLTHASRVFAQDAQTVVMVHGYDFSTTAPAGGNCALGFYQLADKLRSSSDARAPKDVRFVGYYAGDAQDCTDTLPTNYSDIPNLGTRDESIADIARRFADWTYASYTSQGRRVDLVGHSMGGLIIRYAVAYYWDRFVIDDVSYVDDIVTGGAPYDALTQKSVDSCTTQMSQLRREPYWTAQCYEMGGVDGEGGVKARLRDQLLPGWATWSLLGSDYDDGVPSASATYPVGYFDYEYKKVFPSNEMVTHLDYFTNDVLWLHKNPALYYALNALIAPK
jgi:pimeloyl-ACP methyl ester carboxylesterase